MFAFVDDFYNALHLQMFRFNCQSCVHLYIGFEYLSNISQSDLSVISLSTIQSSSYKELFGDFRFISNFIHIYNKNSRGSRIELWGTPDVTRSQFEACPSKTTRWYFCHRFLYHCLV